MNVRQEKMAGLGLGSLLYNVCILVVGVKMHRAERLRLGLDF